MLRSYNPNTNRTMVCDIQWHLTCHNCNVSTINTNRVTNLTGGLIKVKDQFVYFIMPGSKVSVHYNAEDQIDGLLFFYISPVLVSLTDSILTFFVVTFWSACYLFFQIK